MMYSVSPKIAQKLKPVNESCVDNGIEMKVVAAEIQDNKATVLVTMRDTEGSRLDETTDLFDSYSINTPYDQSAGCSFTEYDPNTNTAAFLILIEQNDHILIPGDKVTFSVSQIISGKSHNKYRLNPINTDNVLKISEYLSDPPVRGAGGYDSEDIKLIIPDEKNAVIVASTTFSDAVKSGSPMVKLIGLSYSRALLNIFLILECLIDCVLSDM